MIIKKDYRRKCLGMSVMCRAGCNYSDHRLLRAKIERCFRRIHSIPSGKRWDVSSNQGRIVNDEGELTRKGS